LRFGICYLDHPSVRQPIAEPHGITETGKPGGGLAGGAKLLFGLAFCSGYTWTFRARVRLGEAQAEANRSAEPQIHERGEVCAVLYYCL
jgi:hypothetical protein